MEKKNIWVNYSTEQLRDLENFSNNYIGFISEHKTEREIVKFAIEAAVSCGYKSFEDFEFSGRTLQAGDCVYIATEGKAVIFVHIGNKSFEEGLHCVGAHIDCPRLDLKFNPLFERDGLAYLETQYYGGIKPYQWVTLPLAIHGVVSKKDGSNVNIVIGEYNNDPVFCVTDILPHADKFQMERMAKEVVRGEDLDVLAGNRLLDIGEERKSDEGKKIKDFCLKILEQRFGISEADLDSSELYFVPAGRARHMGLDSSMILGYGHDDRVCAYPALSAQLSLSKAGKVPDHTAVCLLMDKEEIGSTGPSGADSRFFENSIRKVLKVCGISDYVSQSIIIEKTKFLSADVTNAYEPLYAAAFERKATAELGTGISISPYSGGRGKSGGHQGRSEFIAYLRNILDNINVEYTFSAVGKVDVGGGGTIAKYFSHLCIDTIDVGVPVLSMHAPWEVISKADLYETYRALYAFISC
ncbi:MAG: aminopeptidase [Eggerthellaceae bacterium]|nr:aminopeptidase [Eggerthellaceae bacterium]